MFESFAAVVLHFEKCAADMREREKTEDGHVRAAKLAASAAAWEEAAGLLKKAVVAGAPVVPKIRKTPRTRGERWADACAHLSAALDEVDVALGELNEVKGEFEEWRGNLPENLANSPLGEKLETICDLDVPESADDLRQVVDEAEGADLPLGFGRD